MAIFHLAPPMPDADALKLGRLVELVLINGVITTTQYGAHLDLPSIPLRGDGHLEVFAWIRGQVAGPIMERSDG